MNMEHKFVLKVVEENAKAPAGFIRQENLPKIVGAIIEIPGGSENPTDEDKRRAAIVAIERFTGAGTKVKKFVSSQDIQGVSMAPAKMFIQTDALTYEVIKCPT